MGQPASDQRRVHALLGIAREQEVPPRRRSEQDDRRVVNGRAGGAGRGRNGAFLRPAHLEPDVADRQSSASGQRGSGRAFTQRPVPRSPARTHAVHPGLEHPPHAVPLKHANQPRHVVLVRVCQHDHVEPPVPGRDDGVELGQHAVGVRPAVDQQPRPITALDEDGVALPHVEHDDAVDARDEIGRGDRRDRHDERGDREGPALQPGGAAPRGATRWGLTDRSRRTRLAGLTPSEPLVARAPPN